MLINIKYNLKEEQITYNSFEEIVNYDKIVYINFENNKITSLPKLPNSIVWIHCWYNQLTSLQELPNSLKYLDCGKNNFIKFVKHKYLVKIIF